MYIIMCQVSGGVTGFRQSPLKQNGAVQRFATLEEAHTEGSAPHARAPKQSIPHR